jgi:hypothetical protein
MMLDIVLEVSFRESASTLYISLWRLQGCLGTTATAAEPGASELRRRLPHELLASTTGCKATGIER